jgi:hypothetical protein
MYNFKACREAIIKRASIATIQSCVRMNNVEQLGYTYSSIVEEHFGVKKGTASFGIVVSNLFEGYKCLNKVRAEELEKEIRFHKVRYKTCFSADLKKHHREAHNALVDEERELYKPIRDFVALANSIKKGIK